MPDLPLHVVAVIDVLCVLACVGVALFKARREVFHPAWMLLGLHLYVVTFRVFQALSGRRLLTAFFTWPVAPWEIARAALASDVGLLAMAIVWIAVRYPTPAEERRLAESNKTLFLHFAPMIAAIAVGLGFLSLVLGGAQTRSLGADESWASLGYIKAAGSWPAWGMAIFHYCYGFPLWLSSLTLLVLACVGYFNQARFAVVLPAILIGMFWMARGRVRSRGGVRLLFLAPVIIALWLPMKPFFNSLWVGHSVEVAFQDSVEYLQTSFELANETADTAHLDMIASWMTIVDVRGTRYWGTSIAPVFVGLVPRTLWHEKPWLNQYLHDLEIPERRMAMVAMTPGLVGEAYANFGYLGIPLYWALVTWGYSRAFMRARLAPLYSRRKLIYFLFLCSLPQVYRDGLISVVMFPLVYASPVVAVALCSLGASVRGKLAPWRQRFAPRPVGKPWQVSQMTIQRPRPLQGLTALTTPFSVHPETREIAKD